MGPEYTVYVIQVRSRCARCKRRRKPGMLCCVYVGSTSKTPAERLAEHLDPPPRYKKTVVTHCGGMLRPDLTKGLTFPTQAKAQDAEASLVAHLKDQGYTVLGGPQARD